MKTIFIIFLVWFLISLIIAFLYSGHKAEDYRSQVEVLERKLAGMKKENEKLSLRVVEAEMGGWLHKNNRKTAAAP